MENQSGAVYVKIIQGDGSVDCGTCKNKKTYQQYAVDSFFLSGVFSDCFLELFGSGVKINIVRIKGSAV